MSRCTIKQNEEVAVNRKWCSKECSNQELCCDECGNEECHEGCEIFEELGGCKECPCKEELSIAEKNFIEEPFEEQT